MAKFRRKKVVADEVIEQPVDDEVIEQPVAEDLEQPAVEDLEQPAVEDLEQPENSESDKKDDPSIDTMVTRLKTAFAESRSQTKHSSANFVIQVRLPADCEHMYKSLPTLAKREVKAVFESAIRSAYKLIEESEQ